MCAAPKGQSLHIGLNAVDPAAYRGWRGDMLGGENDARAMQTLATGLGYATNPLLGPGATVAAVRQGIEDAAGALERGDIFLLTFSGHGRPIPDVTGDEDDGVDETWCLFDDYLIDDELRVLWHRFAAGVRIVVVSDSCYSGTITYSFMLGLGSGFASSAWATLTPPRGARMQPPAVMREVYEADRGDYVQRQIAAKAELLRRGELACTVRLLSACAEDEWAQDRAANGVFTKTLLDIWDGGAFEGNYARFHREILRRLQPRFTPQHLVVGAPDPLFDAQRPFTIAGPPAGAIEPDRRATWAIVQYLLDRRASDLDDWRSRIPATDWELDDSSWMAAVSSVAENFNSYDPGRPRIDTAEPSVGAAIRRLRDRPLAEFHQCLVDLSEKSDGGPPA